MCGMAAFAPDHINLDEGSPSAFPCSQRERAGTRVFSRRVHVERLGFLLARVKDVDHPSLPFVEGQEARSVLLGPEVRAPVRRMPRVQHSASPGRECL